MMGERMDKPRGERGGRGGGAEGGEEARSIDKKDPFEGQSGGSHQTRNEIHNRFIFCCFILTREVNNM